MPLTQSVTGLDQVFLSTSTTAPSPRKSSTMKSGHRNGALPNDIPATGERGSTAPGGWMVIAPGVAGLPAALPPPPPPPELPPFDTGTVPVTVPGAGVAVGWVPLLPPGLVPGPQLLVQPGLCVGGHWNKHGVGTGNVGVGTGKVGVGTGAGVHT